MWPPWDSQRERNGQSVALRLRILGIHHWSLSRKMPQPDGWEGMYGTSGRFLFQYSGHCHYSARLQEFLERSSRQTTGLSLQRSANDAWKNS